VKLDRDDRGQPKAHQISRQSGQCFVVPLPAAWFRTCSERGRRWFHQRRRCSIIVVNASNLRRDLTPTLSQTLREPWPRDGTEGEDASESDRPATVKKVCSLLR
jgi:hypothetical protein